MSAGLDFRALFEATPGLYLILLPDFTVIGASDAYLAATMTRRENIVGRALFEVFPGNDPQASGERNVRAPLLNGGHQQSPDAMAVQKSDIRQSESDGGGFEERFWSPINSPILGPDGEVLYIIHRVEDVTEFVRLEQRGSERHQLAEQLRSRAANMEAEVFQRASEIQAANERLRVANTELDRREKELTQLYERLRSLGRTKSTSSLPDDARRALEVVERNARSLARHVNDFLDVAELETGKAALDYRRIDLAPLLRRVTSCFEFHAREHGYRFDIEAPSEVQADLDADKVERVLANWIANAFEFTPGGGVRSLGTGCIEIADSGPGVAPATRFSIFERFIQAENTDTRRHGGTGLGLAIAKDFVALNGGTIELGRAAGGGAGFAFTLPREAPRGAYVGEAPVEIGTGATVEPVHAISIERAAGTAPRAAPTEAQAGRPLVLVIEDNDDLREHIRSILDPQYRTEGAGDGKAGLELARQLRPDLIISDVMMPVLSGVELLAALRSSPELAETPVVTLTTRADDALRMALLKGGAQDYVLKPFAPEELLTRAHNLVAASRRHYERLVAMNQRLEAANRDLEHFTHIAAHDMREPLRRQRNVVDLIIRELPPELSEATRPLLEALARASTQSLGMIDDFRALTRLGGTERVRASFELRALIESCVAELADELARHAVSVRWDDLPPTTFAYESLLRLLYQNLIANALENADAGGFELRFTCECGAQPPVFGVFNSNSTISAARLPEVFKMFSRWNTARADGSGIGLSICQRIVEHHRGRIWAESGERFVHIKFTLGEDVGCA